MIKFPETTYVNKLVPKNSFYKHLSMNADIKAHFINDIERIVWAYKLAPSTMNVSVGKNVQEIVVFLIILKEKKCPNDIFIFIDKNIPRHTAFILSYRNEQCVLINYKEKNSFNVENPYKVIKTYSSNWLCEDLCSLNIEGSNMDLIYENMIREVAGSQIMFSTDNLRNDIDESQKRDKIIKDIQLLKSKINAERQPQKKFLLHKELRDLENKLNNGIK